MKCPTCGQNTPDAWQTLIVSLNLPDLPLAEAGRVGIREVAVSSTILSAPDDAQVTLDWMRCANDECKELACSLPELTLQAACFRAPFTMRSC